MNDKNKDDIRKRLEELRKENNRNRGDNDGGKSPFFGSPFVFLIIVLVVIAAIYTQDIHSYFQVKKEIPYTEFVTNMKEGKFKEIQEKDDKLFSVIKESNRDVIYSTRKITERVGNDPNVMNAVNQKKVKLVVSAPSRGEILFAFMLQMFPMIIMIGLMFYLARRMLSNSQGGPGNIFGFGKSKTDKLDKKPDVKFDDVAGVDGAKEELKEVVDFLKNPEKYTKAGARVPKGVLLLGRPGTGKTLLAKAVAGESGASFFSISGSEFVEMFVGVGASRVRDLFEKAKASTPSIIFIDEIDAIGRRRSVGKNSGNDEREQTLNQLLVEMDGFETDTKVIVIAATNREDVLDPALLRAGRFDRRVTVDAPDVQGRVAILKVHARNKKLDPDVRLEDIAKITPGFVGADLANLLNEAAILAARRASDTIIMADLDEAVDKIGMGLGQKSKIIKPEEKKLLAYHEAGHAIMTELTPGADPVHKVTIIPRGEAGGFMMPLTEEKIVTTSKEMLAEIKVLFGGRAAEELVLDDISTGAYSDIKRATRLARIYVESVGMSKKIGPVNLENSEEEFNFTSNKSDETVREIDLEIREILHNEYQITLNTLNENRAKLDNLAELLLKKETITGDEVRKIISGSSVQEVIDEVDTTGSVENPEDVKATVVTESNNKENQSGQDNNREIENNEAGKVEEPIENPVEVFSAPAPEIIENNTENSKTDLVNNENYTESEGASDFHETVVETEKEIIPETFENSAENPLIEANDTVYDNEAENNIVGEFKEDRTYEEKTDIVEFIEGNMENIDEIHSNINENSNVVENSYDHIENEISEKNGENLLEDKNDNSQEELPVEKKKEERKIELPSFMQ